MTQLTEFMQTIHPQCVFIVSFQTYIFINILAVYIIIGMRYRKHMEAIKNIQTDY